MTGRTDMTWAQARAAAEGGAKIARPFWHWCWLETVEGVLRLRSRGQQGPGARWSVVATDADGEATDWLEVEA